METFGSGNFPTNRQDFLDLLKQASDAGVIIVNVTQCNEGCVSELYETGRLLAENGVIAGYDMTTEAALTKLAYILEKCKTKKERIEMMQSNIRGELTSSKPAGYF